MRGKTESREASWIHMQRSESHWWKRSERREERSQEFQDAFWDAF